MPSLLMNARSENALFGIGPGGLNGDRDATAVELCLDIPKSSLPQEVKARLIALGGRHVTSAGILVVVARADRSQVQNRSAAHARLLALLGARGETARESQAEGTHRGHASEAVVGQAATECRQAFPEQARERLVGNQERWVC